MYLVVGNKVKLEWPVMKRCIKEGIGDCGNAGENINEGQIVNEGQPSIQNL